MQSVLLFTNTAAPYRLPVFEQLSQFVDLHVLFARAQTENRWWDARVQDYSFQHTILSHRMLQMGNAAQVLNPRLGRYLRRDWDLLVLADNRGMVIGGLQALRRALGSGRPVVAWTGMTRGEASVARSGRLLQRFYDWYRSVLFRRAAAILAYGTATKQCLVERGVSDTKVVCGTQVVPAQQLPPARSDKSVLGFEGKTVVLSVNYLLPRKGLDTLVRAFRSVAGSEDALVLVGSGPEEALLRELAGGDDRILFPGYCDGVHKSAWYEAADLFAFPTLHDPWGLVVNEAMAFGLPIVTTDGAGCAPDLVKGNGVVVPAGDVQALADALQYLLSDEKMRHEMGQRSRAIVAGYTVEVACAAFVEAIELALGTL